MNISKKKLYKIWQTGVVLLLNILIIVLACASGADALSKMGSSGAEVREIQTKLKDQGIYTGTIDGIYGSKTKAAVTAFQKKNSLTPDGIAGSKTLSALGVSSKSNSEYSSSDYNLLARLISAEARGEPYNGQVAVGAVVLNRVRHSSFPNTVAGVIYQAGAFTCMTDGQFWMAVADSCYRAARDALNGMDPSGGAIYYYNPVTATNKWIRSRPLITTIGKHLFCS